MRPKRTVVVRAGLAAAVAIALVSGAPVFLRPAPAAATAALPAPPADTSCRNCHTGIEDMHPAQHLTCTECHGGDGTKDAKEEAHVVARFPFPNDERVIPLGFNADVLQFRNPMDLRVVQDTCGFCHPDEVDNVPLSLHGTTAGHLGDGLYENGVVRDRHPRVSIFPVVDPGWDPDHAPEGAVRNLQRIPGFKSSGRKDSIATHFSDVPRKACMNCHLWTRGRGVRGRLGMDGDYRGDGCAACHVPYEDDGITRSADRSISRAEPGHPSKHRMVRVPPTNVCTRCHYGDASIGLTFRGLAQPVPGMPQSPDAAGFAKKRLNGMFYVRDDAVNPPDIHHARGMQCADCHTAGDTMGDGHIYTRMEDAVEIECSTCHGTPEAYATGETTRGNPVRGLERRDDGFWLRSPYDGTQRRIKQARDIVDPTHSDFNRKAAMAMTSEHARLECYTCHTGWNPNFFGFHFDRNEQFTQLDVLDGDRTQGRVNTQEKVFATFKQFQLGWDSHGSVAPYMVGFSTMATVHAEDGSLILDQEMPVTAAGLSGMTMIHHQPHATTPRARTCVECHRSPTTWGYGSVNFRLTRELLYAAGARGLHLVGFDRKQPEKTRVIAQVGLPPIRALAVRNDDHQGRGQTAFAVGDDGTFWAVDLRKPLFPKAQAKLREPIADPRALLVADDRVYVAAGEQGILVIDASNPSRLRVEAELRLLPPDLPDDADPDETPADGEASGLFLDGPWLWVACGTGGLRVYDVQHPDGPRLVSRTRLGDAELPSDARDIALLFQYSRPNPTDITGPRIPPRALAAVADARLGLFLVDATEPKAPRSIARVATGGSTTVTLGTIFELGSEGGGIPSRERDYAFAGGPGGVVMIDVTDPHAANAPGGQRRLPGTGPATQLHVLRAYNPPFLQTFLAVANAGGLRFVEVTRPDQPAARGAVALPGTAGLAVEEFPLDRMIDFGGKPLKDVSHEGARYLDRDEIRKVLRAPVPR